MDQRARLRINLSEREFEVEGSEAFVRAYAERLDALLAVFEDEPLPPPAPTPAPAAEAAPSFAPTPARNAEVASFGGFLQHLPKSSTDVDKMLAAGFFAQGKNGDNAFATGDANKLLAEQSIKIGNPSQCVKQNLISKRVFTIQRGRYRVARQGLDHLRQLMGSGVVPE